MSSVDVHPTEPVSSALLPSLHEDEDASQIRSSMAFKLADLIVLPAGTISANERSIVADMMLQILGNIGEPVRLDLARRISRVSECPPALQRRILLDEPEIAGVLLEHADHIPSALLIECARDGTTAHRMMIAKRQDLTSSCIDVLIAPGEFDVAKAILRREDVTLSPFSIEQLVSLSASDPEMQSLLLRRREIEPAHGFLMFWWVKGERRKRILTRFSLDRTIVQEAFKDLYAQVFNAENPDPFVKDILVMNDRRHQPRGLNGERIEQDIVRKALSKAYRTPTEDSISAVSMIANISRELAGRILRDEDGEPYAILCKSLSIPRDEFYANVQIGDGKSLSDENEHAENLMAVFDSIARDFSRAIIRYWDWRSNPRLIKINDILDTNGKSWIESAASQIEDIDLIDD